MPAVSRILIAVLAMSTLGACGSKDTVESKDVNEEKIYGSYYVLYDANDERLYLQTQFRLGGDTGTTLSLTNPSKIFVDGEEMAEKNGEDAVFNITGTYYKKELKDVKQPKPIYRFRYVQESGSRSYFNNVELPKAFVIDDKVRGMTFSAQEDLLIPLVGDELQKNEYYYCNLFLKNKDSASDPYTVSVAKAEENTCKFTKQQLGRLAKGEYQLKVIKEKKTKEVNGHDKVGGIIKSQYVAPKLNLSIK